MATMVTGGAGFIGSHLCESLLEKGEVICIDNLDGYYSPEYKKSNIKNILKNKNFKFFQIDITKQNELEVVFRKLKIEKIVHLAAKAGVRPSIIDPVSYENTNVLGTLNLLNKAKEYKIRNFIFCSSSSVYGNSSKVPFSEDEKTDTPISPYAATKKSAELLCYTYSHLYGISTTCLRLFTVYGPRGRPDMAPYKFTDLIHKGAEIQVFGDGKNKRDYTYIKDIVDGINASIENMFEFEVINLGNSNPVELNRLIGLIEESLGKKAKIKKMPRQPGEVDITYSNISKAKKLLNWKPKTSIEKGVKELVEWYKNERA